MKNKGFFKTAAALLAALVLLAAFLLLPMRAAVRTFPPTTAA